MITMSDLKIGKLVLGVIISLFLLSIPLFTQNPYYLRALVFVNMFAVFAASWDIIGGYTGLRNFGHSFFFGVGGYVTGLFSVYFGLPLLLCLLLGVATSCVAGILMAIPCLGKKGAYLTMFTLIFPLIGGRVVLWYPEITGAEEGLGGIATIYINPVINYLISVVFLIVSITVLLWITSSRIGLTFRAIREDAEASECLGINVSGYMLLAFAIGAVFAGITGSYYAMYLGHIGPEVFGFFMSAEPIWYTIIGGMGTVVGPVIGAYILRFSMEYFLSIKQIHLIIYSSLMILIMFFMPKGLVEALRPYGIVQSIGKAFGKITRRLKKGR